jgi:hypothetical protein
VQFPPPPFDSLRSLIAGQGCANRFWHSLAKIVAGVCDLGPSRAAGLIAASYKDFGRQNPLAHPQASSYPQTLNTGLTFLDQASSIGIC